MRRGASEVLTATQLYGVSFWDCFLSFYAVLSQQKTEGKAQRLSISRYGKGEGSSGCIFLRLANHEIGHKLGRGRTEVVETKVCLE